MPPGGTPIYWLYGYVPLENGISDSVVCGIGRNSYFTGTDQKTGSEYGKELWD